VRTSWFNARLCILCLIHPLVYNRCSVYNRCLVYNRCFIFWSRNGEKEEKKWGRGKEGRRKERGRNYMIVNGVRKTLFCGVMRKKMSTIHHGIRQ
jgi:hypothetical protein